MRSLALVRTHVLSDEEPQKKTLPLVSNIPIPKKDFEKAIEFETMRVMKVGQSFISRRLKTSLHRWAREAGIKILTRPAADGYLRVWRKA